MRLSRAFSLLELVVCCALLTVLGVCLWLIFRTGSRSWLFSSQRAQKLSAFQLVLRDLQGDLEEAPAAAVVYDATSKSLSFPSRWPPQGQVRTYSLEPKWQKYVILFWQSQALFRGEVAAASNSTQSLSAWSGQPQASFCVNGTQVAAEVAEFQALEGPSGCWRLSLRGLPDPNYPTGQGVLLSRSYFCHL